MSDEKKTRKKEVPERFKHFTEEDWRKYYARLAFDVAMAESLCDVPEEECDHSNTKEGRTNDDS